MTCARVGITTYGCAEDGSFSLPANYVQAVCRAGASVVLLPPAGAQDPTIWLDDLDALILAGGGDIEPTQYGGRSHPSMYMTDAGRDETEFALLHAAVTAALPTLCICRGVQILNVALGGSLVGHLPDEVGLSLAHRTPPRRPAMHEILIETPSLLANTVGPEALWSASWHHQAVEGLADGLNVNARAADGTIEGLELDAQRHPWMLGVQWHPELTAAEDTRQQALFSGLVDAAMRGKS
jgi:putative glutamine amidotransferase